MPSRDLATEYIAKCKEVIKTHTIRALSRLGNECVNYVRDRTPEESWEDHTGNLRSSVGYMILNNGEQVETGGFQPTKAPEGNGTEGQAEGEKFLKEVVTEIANDNSFALVIVAGMNYAEKVEALDNKNVLSGAHLFAIEEWRHLESDLQRKIEEDINKIQII